MNRQHTQCSRGGPKESKLTILLSVHSVCPQELGEDLRNQFRVTMDTVLAITGHSKLTENNKTLRRLIETRNPILGAHPRLPRLPKPDCPPPAPPAS